MIKVSAYFASLLGVSSAIVDPPSSLHMDDKLETLNCINS